MHDPTEGGLATGVHELAEAARLGALVEKDAVPISQEGAAICSTLGIDPLGVITSGALLLAVPPENENFLRGILEEAGGLGIRIGTLLPPAEGVTILQSGKRFPLPRFDADEISKVL
jgi:hydrogenase maturation factor